MTIAAPARDRLLKAIDRMDGLTVLVVADLVLDEFEYGEIERVSREAPVLILNHRRMDRLPGGGANAVNNIRSLGGLPVVVGRVGADEPGDHLIALLSESGAEVSGIWRDPDYRTPVKRRILAGGAHSVKQQIVRIDRGGGPAVPAEGTPLLRHVRDRLPRTRGTLVSDYGFGLVHPGTIGTLLPALQEARHPLFVDSRLQLRLFRGITAATPNLQEAEAILGEPIGDDPARLRRAGTALRESLGAEALVMTQGSLGMSVFAMGEEPMRVPVYGTDEVADVTGAGDTVIGALTLAVLAGCRYDEAALLATYAGGIVVMKRGTATVSREELRQALSSDAGFERRLRKV